LDKNYIHNGLPKLQKNLKNGLKSFTTGLSRGRLRTDGRTNDRTMAVGSSVTSTHCNVRFKVTLGINQRVRADAGISPSRHRCVSTRTHSRLPPSPPLSCPVRTQSAVRADARQKKLKLFFSFFHSCCRLEKKRKIGFRFLIPKIHKLPELRGQIREKKKVFSA
jgi:hypothetical protein